MRNYFRYYISDKFMEARGIKGHNSSCSILDEGLKFASIFLKLSHPTTNKTTILFYFLSNMISGVYLLQ